MLPLQGSAQRLPGADEASERSVRMAVGPHPPLASARCLGPLAVCRWLRFVGSEGTGAIGRGSERHSLEPAKIKLAG